MITPDPYSIPTEDQIDEIVALLDEGKHPCDIFRYDYYPLEWIEDILESTWYMPA